MMVVKNKKQKKTKRWVIKNLKFENYENSLESIQFDNIMKKKNEINVDSHKKGYKEFVKIMN